MEQYHFDWYKILMGDVPVIFLLEAAIRITFIYVLLVIAMRLIGKRLVGQVSRNEIGGLVTLAAAIGVPMQDPQQGLLPGVVIAVVVILTELIVSKWAFHYPGFEHALQGSLSVLVKDGVLQLKPMLRCRITKERLSAELRVKQYKHLGQVRRMYMEAGGDFTIVEDPTGREGLSLIPDWDTDYRKQQNITGTQVCKTCGDIDKTHDKCTNCGNNDFENAVK